MTKNEIHAFRRALQSKQTELCRSNGNRQGLAIETSPDELDRIQHASERDYAMDSLERNSNLLREVQGALHRINSGDFGICVSCEDAINPKRLAAVPWASSCIVCQEASEKALLREIDTSSLLAA